MASNPPIGSIYHKFTTYILPSGGLYATYHLLREPETTIEDVLPGIVSGDRITPIYKPKKSHLEGVPQPDVYGDLITITLGLPPTQ